MKKYTLSQFKLPVITLKQGDYFVVYTPVLDLSSYAEDLEDAMKKFAETVDIYVEEMSEKGTLESELLAMGWEVNEKNQLEPPVMVEHTVQTFNLNA